MTNYEKLLEKIDIVDFIGKYVKLDKKGENYIGYSPFKDEKTPSFVVSPKKKIFKDFSSQKGGNVIAFYAFYNDIDYKEAIRRLYKEYNIVSNFVDNKYEKYYKILEKAHSFFKEQLSSNDYAKRYLYERNYTDEDIKKYELGYSNENFKSLYNYLSKEYSTEDIQKVGLVSVKDDNVYDIYNNRIIIPIYDKYDRVIAFGGRNIFENDDNAKYINTADTILFKKNKELFSIKGYVKYFKEYDVAILMEGYFDVLTTIKSGINSVVASLGTAFSKEQAKLISTYTKKIIIAYDNDEAGRNAVINAVKQLIRYDFEIKCIDIKKEVKDPDEYIRIYGVDEYYKELINATSVIKYLFNHYSKNENIETISGKNKLIENFEWFFLSINNPLFYNEYIKELSLLINIEENVLKKLLKKSQKNM